MRGSRAGPLAATSSVSRPASPEIGHDEIENRGVGLPRDSGHRASASRRRVERAREAVRSMPSPTACSSSSVTRPLRQAQPSPGPRSAGGPAGPRASRRASGQRDLARDPLPARAPGQHELSAARRAPRRPRREARAASAGSERRGPRRRASSVDPCGTAEEGTPRPARLQRPGTDERAVERRRARPGPRAAATSSSGSVPSEEDGRASASPKRSDPDPRADARARQLEGQEARDLVRELPNGLRAIRAARRRRPRGTSKRLLLVRDLARVRRACLRRRPPARRRARRVPGARVRRPEMLGTFCPQSTASASTAVPPPETASGRTAGEGEDSRHAPLDRIVEIEVVEETRHRVVLRGQRHVERRPRRILAISHDALERKRRAPVVDPQRPEVEGAVAACRPNRGRCRRGRRRTGRSRPKTAPSRRDCSTAPPGAPRPHRCLPGRAAPAGRRWRRRSSERAGPPRSDRASAGESRSRAVHLPICRPPVISIADAGKRRGMADEPDAPVHDRSGSRRRSWGSRSGRGRWRTRAPPRSTGSRRRWRARCPPSAQRSAARERGDARETGSRQLDVGEEPLEREALRIERQGHRLGPAGDAVRFSIRRLPVADAAGVAGLSRSRRREPPGERRRPPRGPRS